jgi:hypothetical protein
MQMNRRSWVLGFAALAQASLLAAPAALAGAQSAPAASANKEKASGARQAVRWSQDRLSEIDATLAVLERDAASRKAADRQRAEAALKTLRETRASYRTKAAAAAAANADAWSDAQAASARRSLDATWMAFEAQRDGYLATANADLATRRAVLDARARAWQASIDQLRGEAGRLQGEQRAALDARLAVMQAQADEAKARSARLQDASRASWEAVKKSSADGQRLFHETYVSVRESFAAAAAGKGHADKKR